MLKFEFPGDRIIGQKKDQQSAALLVGGNGMSIADILLLTHREHHVNFSCQQF